MAQQTVRPCARRMRNLRLTLANVWTNKRFKFAYIGRSKSRLISGPTTVQVCARIVLNVGAAPAAFNKRSISKCPSQWSFLQVRCSMSTLRLHMFNPIRNRVKLVRVGCSVSKSCVQTVAQQSLRVCPPRRVLNVKVTPANIWANKQFKFVQVRGSYGRATRANVLPNKRVKFVHVGHPMSRPGPQTSTDVQG